MVYTEKYLKRCQFIRTHDRQCWRKGRILCARNGSYEYYCKQHAEILINEGKARRIELKK